MEYYMQTLLLNNFVTFPTYSFHLNNLRMSVIMKRKNRAKTRNVLLCQPFPIVMNQRRRKIWHCLHGKVQHGL